MTIQLLSSKGVSGCTWFRKNLTTKVTQNVPLAPTRSVAYQQRNIRSKGMKNRFEISKEIMTLQKISIPVLKRPVTPQGLFTPCVNGEDHLYKLSPWIKRSRLDAGIPPKDWVSPITGLHPVYESVCTIISPLEKIIEPISNIGYMWGFDPILTQPKTIRRSSSRRS